jgi:hypothetical protein
MGVRRWGSALADAFMMTEVAGASTGLLVRER